MNGEQLGKPISGIMLTTYQRTECAVFVNLLEYEILMSVWLCLQVSGPLSESDQIK